MQDPFSEESSAHDRVQNLHSKLDTPRAIPQLLASGVEALFPVRKSQTTGRNALIPAGSFIPDSPVMLYSSITLSNGNYPAFTIFAAVPIITASYGRNTFPSLSSS